MLKNYSNGIILLDKSIDMSSNLAIQKIKRYFNLKKLGHTGTLDPMATGLLPICVGEATKYSSELLNSHKEYIAEIQLGLQTDSKDITGKILNQHLIKDPIAINNIINIMQTQFTGTMLQTPPIFSALKYQGKPMYHYARAGNTEVIITPREINIFNIELISYDHVKQKIKFKTLVSKGTYIRVLADELSQAICGYGGCLTQLRRTKTGGFNVEDAFTLEQILSCNNLDLILKPITLLLSADSLRYYLSDIELKRILCGNHINLNSAINTYKDQQKILLFFSDHFIGLAEYNQNKIHPTRLISNESITKGYIKNYD
jgi:tRNA pseudouridine55 synthase